MRLPVKPGSQVHTALLVALSAPISTAQLPPLAQGLGLQMLLLSSPSLSGVQVSPEVPGGQAHTGPSGVEVHSWCALEQGGL